MKCKPARSKYYNRSLYKVFAVGFCGLLIILCSVPTEATTIYRWDNGQYLTDFDNSVKYSFNSSDLSYGDFSNLDMGNLDFVQSNVLHAIFNNSIFESNYLLLSNFSDADFSNAVFNDSGDQAASPGTLGDITFQSSNFSGANFSNAYFYNVLFNTIDFSNADLRGAVFSGNTYLENVDMTGALVDIDTFFEQDFDPVAHGAIMVSEPPAPVPEPTTILLLSTGLAGLYGLKRKKLIR